MSEKSEKRIHVAFEASIALKGIFALLETFFGILLATPLSRKALDYLKNSDLRRLIADPDDWLAHFIHARLQAVDIHVLHFWSIYMIGHGGVKLVVVYALMRGWYAAYPFAMAVMAAFICWQLLEFHHTGSIVMLLLSAFDAFIIWLTWKEWQAHTGHHPAE